VGQWRRSARPDGLPRKPVALLGSLDSAATHLAEQIAAKANLVLLSPVTTDKTATLAGLPWMFACAPSDAAVANGLVDAILNPVTPPLPTLALLATTDHESRMLTREVMNTFSRRGRLPDLQFLLPPGGADRKPACRPRVRSTVGRPHPRPSG
jgi:branched-chain amino acid transport system substrate-binding protein